MNDIDAIVKEAEGRIARSGRSALARARAEDRVSRLVEATVASAARPPRASSWRWLASGGVALLAGAALTSVFVRTPPAPPAPAHTPIAMQAVPSPIPAGVDVESLPNAPPEVSSSLPAPRASARPHVAAVASIARSEPSAEALPEPAPSAPENPATEIESASELFERANNSRRAADYASAEKLYRRLLDAYPGSREAATSRIVLGRILLSRSEANAALALFDRYLADTPKGSLAEQALVGRAQCLQRLQRHDEERAAWRRLLETFPGSPNRTEALERLR